MMDRDRFFVLLKVLERHIELKFRQWANKQDQDLKPQPLAPALLVEAVCVVVIDALLHPLTIVVDHDA